MAGVNIKRKESLRDGFRKLAGVIRSLNKPLAHDLENLGEWLYSDTDSGLLYLQKGLPPILKKRKLPNTLSNDCLETGFFVAYKSPNEQELSTESIQRLARLVSGFPLGKEAEQFLTEFKSQFEKDPHAFWHSFSPLEDLSSLSIIRYLSEYFTEKESLDPIRRRILLKLLFERVQSEIHRLQANGNKLNPGQTYKGVTNDTLLDSLWDATDQSKRKKERFTRHVRAGERWAKLEPGVLIGLAKMRAWTVWERSMTDPEYQAIVAYMKSLPSYKLWEHLSPLVSKLKLAFLDHLTGANGDIIQSFSNNRKRAGENQFLSSQQRPQRKHQLIQSSSHIPHDEFTQDRGLPHSHSQSMTLGSHHHLIATTEDNLQVLAEVATSTDVASNEYSQLPLNDIPSKNSLNDFDISVGQSRGLQQVFNNNMAFANGVNDFDISIDQTGIPQQHSSFVNRVNDFDISIDQTGVPQQHSSFVNRVNNFDISTGQVGVPRQALFAGISFGNGTNDFDISAGQIGLQRLNDISNTVCEAGFLQTIHTLPNQQSINALENGFVPG